MCSPIYLYTYQCIYKYLSTPRFNKRKDQVASDMMTITIHHCVNSKNITTTDWMIPACVTCHGQDMYTSPFCGWAERSCRFNLPSLLKDRPAHWAAQGMQKKTIQLKLINHTCRSLQTQLAVCSLRRLALMSLIHRGDQAYDKKNSSTAARGGDGS